MKQIRCAAFLTVSPQKMSFSVKLLEKVSGLITQAKLSITGAFGLVTVGWLRNDPARKFAIKSMKKHEIITSKHVDHIENEKIILNKLDHPFGLKYDGFFQDDRFIYFATELLGGGDLFTYHRTVGNFNSSHTA